MLRNTVPTPSKFKLVLLEDARNREVRSGSDAASPWSSRDCRTIPSSQILSSLLSQLTSQTQLQQARSQNPAGGLGRGSILPSLASGREKCAAQCAGLDVCKIRKMQDLVQAPVPLASSGMSFSKRACFPRFNVLARCGMSRASCSNCLFDLLAFGRGIVTSHSILQPIVPAAHCLERGHMFVSHTSRYRYLQDTALELQLQPFHFISDSELR